MDDWRERITALCTDRHRNGGMTVNPTEEQESRIKRELHIAYPITESDVNALGEVVCADMGQLESYVSLAAFGFDTAQLRTFAVAQRRFNVDIFAERVNNKKRWGIQRLDLNLWMAILGEEFGETCQAALKYQYNGWPIERLREEVVQVAAVCAALLEDIDNRVDPNHGYRVPIEETR